MNCAQTWKAIETTLVHITNTMVFMRLQDFNPIMDAIYLFSNYINQIANLCFSQYSFSMVTSHPSLSFTARLHIFGNFCVNYYVDNPFSTNVSLQYFRDATVAVARTGFDTITMSLDNPFQATLISENSCEYLLSRNKTLGFFRFQELTLAF